MDASRTPSTPLRGIFAWNGSHHDSDRWNHHFLCINFVEAGKVLEKRQLPTVCIHAEHLGGDVCATLILLCTCVSNRVIPSLSSSVMCIKRRTDRFSALSIWRCPYQISSTCSQQESTGSSSPVIGVFRRVVPQISHRGPPLFFPC